MCKSHSLVERRKKLYIMYINFFSFLKEMLETYFFAKGSFYY